MYLTGVFKRTSIMLSGPPGRQKLQLKGTADSNMRVCFSPGSTGIMKPCKRCLFSFKASWLAVNSGRLRFFTTWVFTSASTDQGKTSARGTSGAIGLLAPCTPAPLPAGKSMLPGNMGAVWATTGADRQAASPSTARARTSGRAARLETAKREWVDVMRWGPCLA